MELSGYGLRCADTSGEPRSSESLKVLGNTAFKNTFDLVDSRLSLHHFVDLMVWKLEFWVIKPFLFAG